MSSLDEAAKLVRRTRALLETNQTAAAGQAIHFLRLRFPDHPELEALEAEREALYYPEAEQASFVEEVFQSLPSAQILVIVGTLLIGVGGLSLIVHEIIVALTLAIIGALIILLSTVRRRFEDGI